MKNHGNIRFTRRVVSIVCMLLVAVSVLIPAQAVRADTYTIGICNTNNENGNRVPDHNGWYSSPSSFECNGSPLYRWDDVTFASDQYHHRYGIFSIIFQGDMSVVPSNFTKLVKKVGSVNYTLIYYSQITWSYSDYINRIAQQFVTDSDYNIINPNSFQSTANYNGSQREFMNSILDRYVSGDIGANIGFQAKVKAYSEIGCLDNVQMETYITNKKELDYADENADLAKINQDKVVVYSSTSTTGIDLSKGGYKVQLYGSYAWQDKSGNIKSEDKGHKTFIKDWNAENNIKGLNRSNYTWIDWKTANDKVEADKTDNAHKPNAFEKMTTYANYQYEPIWYLRIVSQDNKYGAWVKLYNSSTKKGNYDSDSVDDDGNKVSDSDGGYDKTKSTSEITGTGDTPEDAKDNVQKAEEKQDNKDIQDAFGGSNSTFDKLEEFTKGIGDVPKMIADIFSFLPSWCLEVVAIGFALLIVLIVVKFIRG